jgi:uncharacterized protein RhaS with RHS repeats
MYISQDPIRLNGGLSLYSYVQDTNGWVDLLGLAKRNDAIKNKAPIDLVDGYRARKDIFQFKGEADFEVHVYKVKGRKLEEVGVINSSGEWIPKHGHSAEAPDLPDGVNKKLNSLCNK